MSSMQRRQLSNCVGLRWGCSFRNLSMAVRINLSYLALETFHWTFTPSSSDTSKVIIWSGGGNPAPDGFWLIAFPFSYWTHSLSFSKVIKLLFGNNLLIPHLSRLLNLFGKREAV